MPELVRSGVRLHYLDEGAGPAVFFHTGGGGDGRMWKDAGYLQALPRRRYLLYDHRGHGQSDKPEGLEAHQLEQYIGDVVAVLDAAEVDRAALVSYSDGAHVVFELARRHPERASAIVHIGGVHHPDEGLQERRQAASNARKVGLRAVLEEMAAEEDEPAPGWLMENLSSTATEMFALELEGWAEAPSYCTYLSEITAPTLIVCGERENLDGAVELAIGSLPVSAMHVIPGFGHLQAFWRVDVTGPIIRQFLTADTPTSS
jgi:pimeloyl-ACP methyl ester carboxylesterase